MSDNNSSYSSSNIQVLEGLEAVRKRPGMYIGTTSKKGLHHLIWEIVDNSVDEAIAGHAKNITITIDHDNWITVEDDGRGIPVDIHPKTNLSTVETVLTVLHAGGKFDKNSYKVSGGLHGVGASVVNALSTNLSATVYRNNKIYYVEFVDGGKNSEPLKVVGEYEGERSGTIIKFRPDYSIMEKNDFELSIILDRAKQLAYLNRGITVQVNDNRINDSRTFFFEGGIVDFIKELNKSKKHLHEEIIYAEGSHSQGSEYDVYVEVALQYTEGYTSNVVSYANNITTIEGGTHEQGFNDALWRLINNYAMEKNIIRKEKEEEKFSRDDVKEGASAIISIKHADPIFEGQTKGKLGNKDARVAVNKVFSEVFERYLNENPAQALLIVQKVISARKARIASNSARDAERKKAVFDNSSLPGKLADCSSKNPERRELYIVEGNSAGGSAKMGRDREVQAILPLRGKVINSEKNAIDKVLGNEEIRSLIVAFGTGIGDNFNINKLRYHKIIIMTDADVDGAHIRTLLLTFLYRYFKPLIEYGFVYIAQPPLFKITHGKTLKYAYTEEEKNQYLASLAPTVNASMQRYKGLGEMNPEQLWETTMDPAARAMYQVQIDDAAKADWTFTTLMGDDVLPRREFIEENARYVVDLDV
ncbi:DNA topoisomerase (ATP-hydrolyzing) subunit B [Mycoplasmopsis agassizii]|uniref:DNA gyrase subunit B n=1 Tax=Mycoplasmopsis agassizii TaxID=33922 RepID=A0A1W1WW81_9BACT|nr:DNA topoisomerase (ATP-hydrolyzing) subunit B [Mycoplasmopsis agassizii]PAF54712.1 DNA topoisomerase (ATP-hydrolyzing) subunit B [Mycoplasmopsis agassizii]PAK21460.1 DNA topoisomerase (ATP-hydrolyzing) subunit B [Mycoplasmopsis agassizii]SMC15962.1 DNA gyrase subunit B [Mycoplasmopsis agassizii]